MQHIPWIEAGQSALAGFVCLDSKLRGKTSKGGRRIPRDRDRQTSRHDEKTEGAQNRQKLSQLPTFPFDVKGCVGFHDITMITSFTTSGESRHSLSSDHLLTVHTWLWYQISAAAKMPPFSPPGEIPFFPSPFPFRPPQPLAWSLGCLVGRTRWESSC